MRVVREAALDRSLPEKWAGAALTVPGKNRWFGSPRSSKRLIAKGHSACQSESHSRWMVVVLSSLALLLLACGPSVTRQLVPTSSAWNVETLAIYPFTMRFSQTPSLSYEKTVDLVTEAVGAGRFQIYSYGDFQLFTLDNGEVYEGRSLLSIIRDDKVDINSFAIMKGGVELLGEMPSKRSEAPEAVAARVTLPVRAWVEIVHYKEQVVLARTELKLTLDPVKATQTDPFPALTQGVRLLAREALQGLSARVKVPDVGTPIPFRYYADHSLLFRIATDDVPSLSRYMSSQDEVENTIQLLRGYQYFYPAITTLEVERLQLSPGLLVTSILEPWVTEQGLAPGDIIVGVGGQPVMAAHQLARYARRLSAGTALTVQVRRQGKPLDIVLTRPAPKK